MNIDVANRIGVVTRAVRTREHEGGPARVVLASRIYDTTVDDLWAAVTNPERIARWFLPVSGALRPGGRYQLEGNAGGEVTRCEPPRLLGLTWEFGGDVSWLELRLRPEDDDRTLLELEHTARVDEERWVGFGPGAVGVGWDLALMGLSEHVATGAAHDPAAWEAWSASHEGRDFMRRSSEAWRDASVADGTDGAEATAAAQRTTAFYTGEDVDSG